MTEETDTADSDAPTKRAILLIPGLSRAAQQTRAEALTDNLEAVVQQRHLTRGKPVTIAGMQGFSLTGDATGSGAPSEVHVFEAYWSDLLYSVSSSSPWGKLWNGFELLLYWFVHPANIKSILFSKKMISLALLGGAALLIAWYMTIAMHVASAVGGDPASDPLTENGAIAVERLLPGTELVVTNAEGEETVVEVQEVKPAEAADAEETDEAANEEKSPGDWVTRLIGGFIETMKWLAERPWWGLLVLLLGFMKIDVIADTARSTKDYLLNRADPTAEKGKDVGLRDKLRRRVIDRLTLVLDAEGYGDVIVVGHSMGALREWPRRDDFARLKLATVAAPFSLFEGRADDLRTERLALIGEDSPLFWWRDYNCAIDYYGEPIEGHEQAFPNQKIDVHIDTWWWQTITGSPHNAFYRSDELLPDIATQPCGPLTERYLGYTHRG